MGKVQITFCGDTYFGQKGQTDDLFFPEVPLQNADLSIINLEGPFLENENYAPAKSSAIYSDSSWVNLLTQNSIQCVCLANNHIMDFGSHGLCNTLKILDRNNINYFGAGMNLNAAAKMKIINIKGKKVGIQGYSWYIIQSKNAGRDSAGTGPLDKSLIIENIVKNKHLVDLLIISFHFCYEFEQYPLPSQRSLCHSCIDAGADIIVGHHPHTMQGVEIYKNKVIAYSLGNFIFADIRSSGKMIRRWNNSMNHSCILFIELFEDNSFNHRVIPLNTGDAKDTEQQAFNSTMKRLSTPLHFDYNEYRKFWRENRLRFLPDDFSGKSKFLFNASFIGHKIVEKMKPILIKRTSYSDLL